MRPLPLRLGIAAAVTFLAVVTTGCSTLASVTTLHSERDSQGWVKSPLKDAKYSHRGFLKYTHQRGQLTVTLCSLPQTWSIVGIGPPLLPLFPGVLFPFGELREWPNDQFFVYVQIDSLSDDANIDFSGARLQVDGKEGVFFPVAIHRYERHPVWDDREVCGRNYERFATVEPHQSVRGRAQFVLAFRLPASDIKSCALYLGNVHVGGDAIAIPPLSYRRERFWFYVPLVIPPEGKVIGPVFF